MVLNKIEFAVKQNHFIHKDFLNNLTGTCHRVENAKTFYLFLWEFMHSKYKFESFGPSLRNLSA